MTVNLGLKDLPTDKIETASSVLDTDLIPIFTNNQSRPKLATVSLLNAGGVLNDNNTWTGTNNFTGGLSISGTAFTATGLEINRLDDSAEVESVTAAGAASVTKFNTNLNVASGGAVTLAACPATMVGKIKTIRMQTDDGDVTIALTNVQGGTAATTATFNDIGEELILIGSAGGKWTVVKEFGVTLS